MLQANIYFLLRQREVSMALDDIEITFEPPFPPVEALDKRKEHCATIDYLIFGNSLARSELSSALFNHCDRTDQYFGNLIKRHVFVDPIPVFIWDYGYECIPDTRRLEAQCAAEALSLNAGTPALFVLRYDLKSEPQLSFHLFYRSGPASQLLPPFVFPMSEWRAEVEKRAKEARRVDTNRRQPEIPSY